MFAIWRTDYITGSAEFYVKVKLSVSKYDVRKKRTGIFKHQHHEQKSPYDFAADDAPTAEAVVVNPVFNESFAFQVSNEMLNACNLIVTAKQAMSTGRRGLFSPLTVYIYIYIYIYIIAYCLVNLSWKIILHGNRIDNVFVTQANRVAASNQTRGENTGD